MTVESQSSWLLQLTQESMLEQKFPKNEILRNSFYYPCSGFDGRPVRFLAKEYCSFIYVDYSMQNADLIEQVESPTEGFSGYEILGKRPVGMQEIVPRGWKPFVLPDESEVMSNSGSTKYNGFCTWIVFQRSDQHDDNYGPMRFSLLFLNADGAATYQALFSEVTPKAIAIISPGHAFGGNYTNYEDPERVFARSVRATGPGMPELLYDGSTSDRAGSEQSIWPDEYGVDHGWLEDQPIRVWGRAR